MSDTPHPSETRAERRERERREAYYSASQWTLIWWRFRRHRAAMVASTILGLMILLGAGLVALQGVELGNFFVALVLLGIGWNFGFIGATTMLASGHAPHERGRMQGMNDMIVFGGVTFASLASGGLMNCSGGTPIEGWTAVNFAMAPFLVLAGGSLIWLALRPRDDEQTA